MSFGPLFTSIRSGKARLIHKYLHNYRQHYNNYGDFVGSSNTYNLRKQLSKKVISGGLCTKNARNSKIVCAKNNRTNGKKWSRTIRNSLKFRVNNKTILRNDGRFENSEQQNMVVNADNFKLKMELEDTRSYCTHHLVNRLEHGLSPVIIAAEFGHYEILSLLIDQGALLDLSSARNHELFLHVMGTKDRAIIQLLLEAIPSTMFQSAIHCALNTVVAKGNLDVLHFLINSATCTNKFGCYNHIIRAWLLGLEKVMHSSKENPLFSATLAGHLDTIAFLLAKGIDVNIADENGMTLLMYAVKCKKPVNDDVLDFECKCIELSQLLIDGGTNVNAQDQQGNTALIWAAKQGSLSCVHFLLMKSNKYIINLKNKEGSTALMAAISAPITMYRTADMNLLMAWNLFFRGSDVLSINDDGNSAIYLAAMRIGDDLDHNTLTNIYCGTCDHCSCHKCLTTISYTDLVIHMLDSVSNQCNIYLYNNEGNNLIDIVSVYREQCSSTIHTKFLKFFKFYQRKAFLIFLYRYDFLQNNKNLIVSTANGSSISSINSFGIYSKYYSFCGNCCVYNCGSSVFNDSRITSDGSLPKILSYTRTIPSSDSLENSKSGSIFDAKIGGSAMSSVDGVLTNTNLIKVIFSYLDVEW